MQDNAVKMPQITLKDIRLAKSDELLREFYLGENNVCATIKKTFCTAFGEAIDFLVRQKSKVSVLYCGINTEENIISIAGEIGEEPFYSGTIGTNLFVLFEELCERLSLVPEEEIRIILSALVKAMYAEGRFAKIEADSFAVNGIYASSAHLPQIVLKETKKGDAKTASPLPAQKQQALINILKTYTKEIGNHTGENPQYARCAMQIIVLHCGDTALIERLSGILAAQHEVNYIAKTQEVLTMSFANKRDGGWATQLVTATPFGGNIVLYSNNEGREKFSFEIGEELKFLLQNLPDTAG